MAKGELPRGLRLGVAFEADALIANLGPAAYSAARLRAQEASSDEIARDWRDVACVIARKTRRRSGGFLPPALRWAIQQASGRLPAERNEWPTRAGKRSPGAERAFPSGPPPGLAPSPVR